MDTLLINSRLKKLIKTKKLTYKEVAESIGYSQNGFSIAMKTGDWKVSTLFKLSDYFKLPIDYWFSESEDNFFLHNEGNLLAGNSVSDDSNISLNLQSKCEDLKKENERLKKDIEMLREVIAAKDQTIETLKTLTKK